MSIVITQLKQATILHGDMLILCGLGVSLACVIGLWLVRFYMTHSESGQLMIIQAAHQGERFNLMPRKSYAGVVFFGLLYIIKHHFGW